MLSSWEEENLRRRIEEETGPVRVYRLDSRVPDGFYPVQLKRWVREPNLHLHANHTFRINQAAFELWSPRCLRAKLYSDDRSRVAFVADEDGDISLTLHHKGVQGNNRRAARLFTKLGAKPGHAYAAYVEREALVVDFRRQLD